MTEDDDLRELARTWRTTTAHLEARIDELAAALARARPPAEDARRARVRRTLTNLGAGDVIAIVVAALVAIAAGSFWIDHVAELGPALCGGALHAYAIATIVVMARRRVLARRIDLAGPVLAAQIAFARLRRFHVASSLALGLAWWFLWIVALEVLARAGLGVDLIARAPAWWWSSIAIGVAGVAGSIAIARVVARRAATAPAWAELLAGRSLARAGRELDELTAYPA